MKKMFISVVALAMSMMAMATETAYVQIKLTGENGGTSSVFLTEDDAYTNAFEPGVDVEKMMSQSNSKSVLLYGFVGTTPCEDVVAANLDGLKIGFTTNQIDENYTLSFIDVSGRPLKLYDRVTMTETTIVGNGTYEFSVEDFTDERLAFNERFVINRQAYNVTLNDCYLATFSADENVIIPEGLNAYTAEFQGEQSELVLYRIEGGYIPAETGVILFNPQGGISSDQKDFSLEKYAGTVPALQLANDLLPASAWEAKHDGYIYALFGDMMYIYENAENKGMKPNKAYLRIGGSSAPRRISFRFSGTTALENAEVNEAKAVKFMKDGEVFIKRGDAIYNLQGQIVK
jgi:hypothetical protein